MERSEPRYRIVLRHHPGCNQGLLTLKTIILEAILVLLIA